MFHHTATPVPTNPIGAMLLGHGAERRSQPSRERRRVKITVPDLSIREDVGKLQAIGHLGLLGRVWPQQRLLVGLAVCKWMNRELISLVDTVELVPSGPVRLNDVRNTLLRFSKHRLQLRWAEQAPNISSPLDRKIWDVRLENFLKALSITLKSRSSTLIDASGEAPPQLQIEYLQLKTNGLGRKTAGMLSEVLMECTMLQTLDLSGPGNKIGAAQQLLGGIGACTNLTHLNLSMNEIGGGSKLLAALDNFRTLTLLDLSSNAIGAKGARQVGSVLCGCAALTSLNMKSTELGNEGVEFLSEALSLCTSLAHLDLADNQVGAQGAERLGAMMRECCALKGLQLRDNKLRASGVERLEEGLRQCTALTHLDISANELGDAGAGRLAAVLGGCGGLSKLALSGNSIANEGAETLSLLLSASAALSQLDLSCNGIGYEGARVVAGRVRECSSLRFLDMRANWLLATEAERVMKELSSAHASVVYLS